MSNSDKKIIAYYKGYKIKATIHNDNTVTYDRTKHTSPSGAAVAAIAAHSRKKKADISVNGWNFWGMEARGEWLGSIGELLRKKKKTKKASS